MHIKEESSFCFLNCWQLNHNVSLVVGWAQSYLCNSICTRNVCDCVNINDIQRHSRVALTWLNHKGTQSVGLRAKHENIVKTWFVRQNGGSSYGCQIAIELCHCNGIGVDFNCSLSGFHSEHEISGDRFLGRNVYLDC